MFYKMIYTNYLHIWRDVLRPGKEWEKNILDTLYLNDWFNPLHYQSLQVVLRVGNWSSFIVFNAKRMSFELPCFCIKLFQTVLTWNLNTFSSLINFQLNIIKCVEVKDCLKEKDLHHFIQIRINWTWIKHLFPIHVC